MTLTIRQIAERLAYRAEDVCGCYLSSGRKEGRYWIVGDVFNTPGRSMYVRLTGPTFGAGAAGKWTDAATGEHGDLLDVIQLSLGLPSIQDARAEALRFLAEPAPQPKPRAPREPVPSNSTPAARRLFAASVPVSGTLAETYLRARGITCPLSLPALRFHPRCYHVTDEGHRMEIPALIAGITDLAGNITAVQRTYLAPDGSAKAAIESPRRSLGDVLGNAIRIGIPTDVVAVGEGLETLLTLRSLLPTLPVAAATSANHLAAMVLPGTLTRLYIAHDHGPAGLAAAQRLVARALERDVAPKLLSPPGDDDWNTALVTLPLAELREALARQLDPLDLAHMLPHPPERLHGEEATASISHA